MDIVVFAQFAGSPYHGMVFGHYYLAREWVRAGHDVTIVSASYVHTRFNQPKVSGVTEEYIDGIRYLWLPTPSYSRNDMLGRLRNILSFSLRCLVQRLPIYKADIVICSSHQPFPIYPARRWALRLQAKLIFEVRDLWPLSITELGKVSIRHPFIRLMQWFEDYAYRHSDKVVSVLPLVSDYMRERGMDCQKFIYIPNGVSLDDDQQPLPDKHVEILERVRARGGFIIGYVGRDSIANTLHTLIHAVGLCKNNNVHIAILGEEAHYGKLRALADRLGLVDQILFLNTVPKAQVPDFLARVDVTYIGLRKNNLFQYGVSPTKINDYMLAAKPIIYAIDAPQDIVSESFAGISCPAESPQAVCAAIEELYGLTSEQRAEIGNYGLDWIKNNRNYKVLAQRFLEGAVS